MITRPVARLCPGKSRGSATLRCAVCGEAADVADALQLVDTTKPDVAVIVATVRALKLHGGASKDDLTDTDVAAVDRVPDY